MTDRELMQRALEALERYQVKRQDFDRFADEIAALRERLAHPEQEPVAWMHEWEGVATLNMTPPNYYGDHWKHTALYTDPPKRKPLTEEQLVEAYCCVNDKEWAIGGMTDARIFARAIERAHGIGGEE